MIIAKLLQSAYHKLYIQSKAPLPYRQNHYE